MKAVIVLLSLISFSFGFSSAYAENRSTQKLTCYDRHQAPPAGVNVGYLTVGQDVLVLETVSPILPKNGAATDAIPAGSVIDLNNPQAFESVDTLWGCFDGTILLAPVFDDSKSDAVRMTFSVQCDRHPRFETYDFSLQCQ